MRLAEKLARLAEKLARTQHSAEDELLAVHHFAAAEDGFLSVE